eukprot:CAMPEP_0194443692 /NCGR_PEP_ID=MMETSP0176-20130528/126851_1 /TAXON_ID=216777 /ORGANISM="Proboscia alata, Strain PI-D3" /LENGTH=850 /DNA_ID=CAMNT_0039269981 /DNA_START=46 /DNA_END=2595 /DNA_ORIENTATION=-
MTNSKRNARRKTSPDVDIIDISGDEPTIMSLQSLPHAETQSSSFEMKSRKVSLSPRGKTRLDKSYADREKTSSSGEILLSRNDSLGSGSSLLTQPLPQCSLGLMADNNWKIPRKNNSKLEGNNINVDRAPQQQSPSKNYAHESQTTYAVKKIYEDSNIGGNIVGNTTFVSSSQETVVAEERTVACQDVQHTITQPSKASSIDSSMCERKENIGDHEEFVSTAASHDAANSQQIAQPKKRSRLKMQKQKRSSTQASQQVSSSSSSQSSAENNQLPAQSIAPSSKGENKSQLPAENGTPIAGNISFEHPESAIKAMVALGMSGVSSADTSSTIQQKYDVPQSHQITKDEVTIAALAESKINGRRSSRKRKKYNYEEQYNKEGELVTGPVIDKLLVTNVDVDNIILNNKNKSKKDKSKKKKRGRPPKAAAVEEQPESTINNIAALESRLATDVAPSAGDKALVVPNSENLTQANHIADNKTIAAETTTSPNNTQKSPRLATDVAPSAGDKSLVVLNSENLTQANRIADNKTIAAETTTSPNNTQKSPRKRKKRKRVDASADCKKMDPPVAQKLEENECSDKIARNAVTPEKDIKTACSSKPMTKPPESNPCKTSNEITAAKVKPSVQPKPMKKRKMTYQDQVLNKMIVSTKPFNMKKLVQATRSSSDAAINFVLLSLIDKELVIKKEFPKGKVLYWANLDMSLNNKDIINALGGRGGSLASDEEIRLCTGEKVSLENKLSHVEKQRESLLNQPTNSELDAHITELENQISGFENRAREAKEFIADKGGKTLGVEGTKKKINKMRSVWKLRKEKCSDFMENLADAMDKSMKDVSKVLDVEKDEAVGVKMPPRHF